MLLERTIHQLDIGHVPPATAERMGQMGYVQWLGGLDGSASYPHEAARAYQLARPFVAVSPAVAVFCRLLAASLRTPGAAVPLDLSARVRRGGAGARRCSH